MTLTEDIKQKAFELGFDLVGITDASPIEAKQVRLFADWLKSGCAGRMNYLHRNLKKRINPAELLNSARSVICLGLNYNPPKTSKQPLQTSAPTGKIANYACYEDYHIFMKKRLRKLIDFVASLLSTGFEFKICVDSAPLAERALAARAGLGFIGKNHMLINTKLGPQIFLAEVITNLKLNPDDPIKDNCSNCSKCIDACPTGALAADGRFDANKCISYLTIEGKGRIPEDLAKKIGAHLFGCDECVLACPYQKDAPVCKNKQFKFYKERINLNLHEILSLTDDDFKKKFADSTIKRLDLDTLKRNAQICLANITS